MGDTGRMGDGVNSRGNRSCDTRRVVACWILPTIAAGIQLGLEGSWTSAIVPAVSYEEQHNDIGFGVEDVSFGLAHGNECILRAVSFPPPGTFFDIGGGNGYVAKALHFQLPTNADLPAPGLAFLARYFFEERCQTESSGGTPRLAEPT
jgi:hypothetical protein